MNYENELKELKDYKGKDWFKPSQGIYSVQVLQEPADLKASDDLKDAEGKAQLQTELHVLVQQRGVDVKPLEKYWTVTKSKTLAGLFGQLMQLGTMNKGLANVKFTLLVQIGNDKKRTFTIPEVLSMNTVKSETIK